MFIVPQAKSDITWVEKDLVDSADKVGELQWAPQGNSSISFAFCPTHEGMSRARRDLSENQTLSCLPPLPAPLSSVDCCCREQLLLTCSHDILDLISSSSSFLPTPAPFPCCHLCLLWLSDLVSKPGRALLVAWTYRGDFIAFLRLVSHAGNTT